ncbi:hypothetical protein AAE478_000640 [Parahypoxylon ruwenzoriense]
MDPASLDPRLRDASASAAVVVAVATGDDNHNENNDNKNNNNNKSNDDSIVVNGPTHPSQQRQQHQYQHQHHHEQQQQQQQQSQLPLQPQLQPLPQQPLLPQPPSSLPISIPADLPDSPLQQQLQAQSATITATAATATSTTTTATSVAGPSPGASVASFTPQTPTSHPHPASSDTPGAPGATPQDPNDPKRPRACEACRGLKVKCEPDPANPDGPCKRCAKAGRNCVVTQPTRKRQKKTDSRVAELEKKIDALTASLQATRGAPNNTQPNTQPNTQQHTPSDDQNGYGAANATSASYASTARDWGAPPSRDHQPPQYAPQPDKRPFAPPITMAGQKRKFAESIDGSPDVASASPAPPKSGAGSEHQPDIIDRGLITMSEAAAYFTRYTEDMTQHLPAVVFPEGTTVAEVRKTKPILFLSVMAAASSEIPKLQRQLVKELMQIFADRIIIGGGKSLEMVQSLIVAVIWYYPPEHFEELKFYQFVHLAAVMSIDIGLGRRKHNPKSRLVPYTWREHPFRKLPLPDPTTIESRRTWLAVYFLASNVAMALHRPNLIRWQAFMTECMDILESSPQAAPTDRYLCHMVWTHRLAEEVGIQFSMDDPTVFVNITEQKVQYALRGFERDLSKYSESIPKADKKPSLLLSFHVLNLYMHEIALHVDKSPEEYRPPCNADSLRDPIPGLDETLTPSHISALSSCLTAIDGIFDTFLSMDVHSIRCIPIFSFVRVAYAVVVLIKMYFSASNSNSELGKVINKDNMKVAEYLEKLLDKFREVAASDKSRPASKFLLVLAMLRSWFLKQGQAQGKTQNDEQLGQSLTSQEAAPSKEHHNGTNPQRHQQRHQSQPNLGPTNTPLQLLSEIATGNGPPRNNSQGSIPPPGTDANAQPFNNPAWLRAVPQPHQPFMYDPGSASAAESAAAAAATGASLPRMPGVVGQGIMPWMVGGPLGVAEFDYGSLGDGFEQAMGLTLTGFGGGSPGDPTSYEDTMRYMMQNDMLGSLPEGFAPQTHPQQHPHSAHPSQAGNGNFYQF